VPLQSPGRRRRRRPGRTLLVVIGVGLVLAGGYAYLTGAAPPDTGRTTPGEPLQVASEMGPERDRDRDPRPGAGVDQLLGTDQVDRLDPGGRWRITATGGRPAAGTVYDECATSRSADPRRRAAYTRTFTARGQEQRVLVQAVEVSRTAAAADAAFRRAIGWYAGCQAPRTQLLDSYSLSGPGADAVVLELRRWSSPLRHLTVALTHSGVVNAVLVHEADGAPAAPRRAFSRTVVAAAQRLCRTSGGACLDDPAPRPTAPPPTGEAPGFVGAVDLPAVAGLRTPWVGTAAAPAGPDVAAALCEGGAFIADSLARVRSRTFVLPMEPVPPRFGLTQTVGALGSPRAAARLVAEASARIQGCPDRLPSVSVDGPLVVGDSGVRGRVWRLTYELPRGEVFHRVGLVRNGRAVTQLTLSPTSRLDPGRAAFVRLTLRAGERLAELP